jgi:ribonuclease P protein component
MVGDGDDRFPSTMRLKKKAEFIRVFREGVTWKGSCFSVHMLRRDVETARLPESGPRLGLVVPRRVGSAVERNRIKRKLREAFRRNAHRLPAVDLVIQPNASCQTASESEIVEGLMRAMKRAPGDAKE